MRLPLGMLALVAAGADLLLVGCGSVSSTGGAGGSGSGGAGGGGGAVGSGSGGKTETGSGGAPGGGSGGVAADAGETDAAGGSGGSGGAGAPGAFTLKTPSNGNPAVTTTPTLTWTASAGAASYQVEVATGVAFGAADVLNMAGVTGTSFVLTTPLQPGVTYAWRVTAVSGAATTVATNAPFWLSSPVAAGASPY